MTHPKGAFHGDPTIRERFLAAITEHEAADMYQQGQDGAALGSWDAIAKKGDVLGCHTKTPWPHDDEFAGPLGLPGVLLHVHEHMFDGLSPSEAIAPKDGPGWARRFAEAIQVGADLSLVWPRLAVALLTDAEHGLVALDDADAKPVLGIVLGLLHRTISGDHPGLEEWDSAWESTEEIHTASSEAIGWVADAFVAQLDDDGDCGYGAGASLGESAKAFNEVRGLNRHEHFSWMAATLVRLLQEAPLITTTSTSG